MDFILYPKKRQCEWRTGRIRFGKDSDSGSSARRFFNFPLCLQYAKDGVIPHLTCDLIKYIPDQKAPLLVSLSSIITLLPALKLCDSSLSDFISSDCKRSVFMVHQDVLTSRRIGFNSGFVVPIWNEAGKRNLFAKDMVECLKAFKPDAYQLMCDGETAKDCSNKRLDRSIENSIELAKNSFAIKEFDWKCKPMFGCIEGGWNIKKRLQSIEMTKSLPVDGFIIDGLLSKDLLEETENRSELKELISRICSELPEDKPRALFGPLKPELVVDVISAGIDIIDTSYCNYLTNANIVLMIDIQSDIHKTTSYLVNMNDPKFRKDFSEIERTCDCYTCSKGFSRAYIYHLITAKEMTASILINLHNLYVYYDLVNRMVAYYANLKQSDEESAS